jgi:hypothetical protein
MLVLGLTLVVSLAACGKQPADEISAAKTAIDSAVGEGAEKYTPEELKAINDELAAAMDAIKVQDGKFLKNYDEAAKMLVKVTSDAVALGGKVGTVKEEMKAAAATKLEGAIAAVAEAKGLLDNAPRGKGSLADIEAMKVDVAGLEASILEVQPLIDSGEYLAANEKAEAIQTRLVAITEEIRAAQEKMAQANK